ncbi:MAG: AAA family ATPase [Gammaproteobacteria bacterium]|nr:AAA family ATPase [Gammaproteobacteria bacterium]
MNILSLKDLIDWQPPNIKPIISSGILHPGTKMFLFGNYKSWKSMLSIHTGFCIALGRLWLGHATTQRRVLIVQLEIPQALYRNRIIDYCKGNNCYPDNIYFASEPYLKLDRDYGVARLDTVLSTLKPEVLILDPLYKLLSGDISNSYAVEVYQSNMDRLLHKHNLTLINVSHTRQQLITPAGLLIDMGADEIMGSSFWPNWIDSAIRVRKDAEDQQSISLTLCYEAMRNALDILHPIKVLVDRRRLTWRVLPEDDR